MIHAAQLLKLLLYFLKKPPHFVHNEIFPSLTINECLISSLHRNITELAIIPENVEKKENFHTITFFHIFHVSEIFNFLLDDSPLNFILSEIIQLGT